MRSCSAPRSRHWRTQQRPMSNAELEFSSIAFRQGYIKLNVKQDEVEHIDPMTPALFVVRPAKHLIMNKAVQLIHERENNRENPCTETTKQKVVPCYLSA